MHEIVSCWIRKEGLGKQLFQISAAYEYSIKYNKKLIFLNEGYLWNTIFNNVFTILNKEEYDKIHFRTYLEVNNNEYNEIPYFENNVYLRGLFTNKNYFSENTKTFIFNAIHSNKDYVEQANELYEKIKNHFNDFDDDKYVFMHFRRKKIKREINNILDISYYYDIYNSIKGDSKYFIIFSDNIEWCKNMFSVNKNFYFVDINNLYVELILMIKIKNAIMANSALSWWGAYLGNKNQVFSPKIWIP